MALAADELEFKDVACQRCSCLCDDLTIRVAGGSVQATTNACPLAEPWFAEQASQTDAATAIAGRACSLDEAYASAAALLSGATAPLIYGLAGCGTAAAQAALALAESLGAVIDVAGQTAQQPALLAMQQVGKSSCTLGEVRHRADLVIYWGVDPQKSHPRHWDRYAVEPASEPLPGGRTDRRVIVIDEAPGETSRRADIFIQIDRGHHFEAVWMLLAMVSGRAAPAPWPASLDRTAWQELAAAMRQCQVGVVFYGQRFSSGPHRHRTVEALFRLVRRLNDVVRFHAIGMGAAGEAATADSILAWSTGFPFAVSLARGYPRYSPSEYTANALLERSEVDACLLVGEQPLMHLSPAAIARLASISTIVLAPDEVQPLGSAVRIATSRVGVHTRGTVDRMDGIPIPLKSFLPSSRPSVQHALNRLRQTIVELRQRI